MNNLQHVQVPQMHLKSEGLLHNDPFIYACIKRYMNNTTKTAFPSINTIVKDTQLNKQTILNSIDRLSKAGYLQIIKTLGKVNEYKFNDYKKFEIFSYEFLDNPNLTSKEKAYLVATQQFMFKDSESNTGTVKFDNTQFAEAIGLSISALKKREKELQKDNILTLVQSNQKELIQIDNIRIPSTGYNICYRLYDFNEFCNTLALKFNQIDDRVDSVEDKLEKALARIAVLETQIQEKQTGLVL